MGQRDAEAVVDETLVYLAETQVLASDSFGYTDKNFTVMSVENQIMRTRVNPKRPLEDEFGDSFRLPAFSYIVSLANVKHKITSHEVTSSVILGEIWGVLLTIWLACHSLLRIYAPRRLHKILQDSIPNRTEIPDGFKEIRKNLEKQRDVTLSTAHVR